MKVHDRLRAASLPGIVFMAMSAIGSAGFHAATQQTQSMSQHRHGGHHAAPLSDVDAAGSSVASAPSPTGKTGSKLDVTA
jgi:hypothetical protein